MPLSAGAKLGPYQILSPIGAGGMGEVYKARDPRLDRTVAVKVSKAEFTERFTREARMVAQLNHPHICTLHDVGPNYLVMEFVDGAPLKGPLPLEKAVDYAGQILDALDAAHRKGITHRDLKPANILVTKQAGNKTSIKLLDFGLAKQAKGLGPNDLTVASVTMEGQITGTLQYMSPEQLQGEEADARSDIFSFGCVLYEMLSGAKAFSGSSAASVIAAILERPAPSVAEIAPAALDRALRKCLAKDPDDRWQSARDLKDELEWIAAGRAEVAKAPVHPASAAFPFAWIAPALLAVVAGGLGTVAYRATRPAEPKPFIRLDADVGAEVSPGSGEGPTLAIAPDGSRLAFVTRASDGKDHLALRLLDSAQTMALADTEGAAIPFFSPDSRWIAFFAGGKLKKISVEGGKPVTLCNAPNPRGASWGEDGNIVFSAEARAALLRVPSSGGDPRPATELDARNGEITNRYPQVLPGGEAFLFQARSAPVTNVESTIQVQSVRTGQRKTLVKGGFYPHYLPSGHLVYMHQGTLYAAPMDLKRLELTGPASPVIEDLQSDANGFAYFDFTPSGTLVYVAAASTQERSLSLMDPSGALTPLRLQPGHYTSVRVSPDGNRFALLASDGTGASLSMYDWAQDRISQIASFKSAIGRIDWVPDGKHLVFEPGANRLSGSGVYWMRADGAGEPQRLLDGTGWVLGTISPDGKRLGYWSRVPPYGLWTLPLDLTDPDHPKAGKPEPLLKSEFEVRGPAFSPDGRWAAYESLESGHEVYVRPFPGPGGKWQVSTGGGGILRWSPNGRELFYYSPDARIQVVDYSAKGDSFAAGQPRLWSQNTPPVTAFGAVDLMPDGKRLVVLAPTGQGDIKPPAHVVFLLNFFDELRRKVPPGK